MHDALVKVAVTGDVVGPAGVALAAAKLAELRRTGAADVVLVNADNAAVSGPSPFGGSGLSVEARDALLLAGADLLLTGSHALDLPESLDHPKVLRAANLPDGPGRGHALLEVGEATLEVVQLAVRASSPSALPPLKWLRAQRFGRPPLVHLICDSPFVTTLFAHAVDGHVAAVVASMNHVPSLRVEVLPGGTGLVWDVGHVGHTGGVGGFDVRPFLAAADSSEFEDALGMDLEASIAVAERRWREEGEQYRLADGPPVFDAVLVDLGPDGLARTVERL
jgi:calcineurin-like phosphoesterase